MKTRPIVPVKGSLDASNPPDHFRTDVQVESISSFPLFNTPSLGGVTGDALFIHPEPHSATDSNVFRMVWACRDRSRREPGVARGMHKPCHQHMNTMYLPASYKGLPHTLLHTNQTTLSLKIRRGFCPQYDGRQYPTLTSRHKTAGNQDSTVREACHFICQHSSQRS